MRQQRLTGRQSRGLTNMSARTVKAQTVRARPAPQHSAQVNTRAWRTLATQFKAHCAGLGAPCWLCRQPIDYELTTGAWCFETDHYHPRKTHPHLAMVWENLRASHRRCNRSRQATSAEDIGTEQEWIVPQW